jgi:hypothetical protein
MCGAACAASQTKIAPSSCARATSGARSWIVPSEFETVRRHDLYVVVARDLVELREVGIAVLVDLEHQELRALAVCDVLPRNEVRVVLELGDDDRVAGAEVVAAPRVGDEVQALGRVSDEDDFACVGRVEERAHLLARAFESARRPLGQHVHRPMDVRVRRLVELRHPVQHLPRLLRRVRGIQVRERLAVDLLSEDGKIRAQRARVKLRTGRHSHSQMVTTAFTPSSNRPSAHSTQS